MNWRKAMALAAVYIGAVMGAGFASGQELVQFFVVYQRDGLLGLLTATLLFIIFGLLLVYHIQKYGVISYQDLLLRLFGQPLGRWMEGLITLSLPMGLLVMLAGAGAVGEEHLGLPPWMGALLTALIVYLALREGPGGILTVNSWLIPVKVVICFAVTGWILAVSPDVQGGTAPLLKVNPVADSWLVATLLYVSFNITLALVVLASVGREMGGGEGYGGAVMGGLGLGAFALAIGGALLRHYPEVAGYEVPMVYLAGLIHPIFEGLYALILWMAMITAAIGNAYGFSQRLTFLTGLPYRWVLPLLLLVGLPFSLQGFSRLVAFFYPLFGFLGLPLLGALLILPWRKVQGRLKLVLLKRFF